MDSRPAPKHASERPLISSVGRMDFESSSNIDVVRVDSRDVMLVSRSRGSSRRHQCTSFPDADHVDEVQRVRHARGDFACRVLVFFETANVSLSIMLVDMHIVKQRQVAMIQW